MKTLPVRRSTLASGALAAVAVAVGLLAPDAYAEPTPAAQPFTVGVVGTYRVVTLTDDGHMLRSEDQTTPVWIDLALPDDQGVEVVSGACVEHAGPTRPESPALAAGTPDAPLVEECGGEQR